MLAVDWPNDHHVVVVVDAGAGPRGAASLVVPVLTPAGLRESAVCDWSDLAGPENAHDWEAVGAVRRYVREVGPSPSGLVSGWVVARFGGRWSLGTLSVSSQAGGVADVTESILTEPVDLRGGPPVADLIPERD